MTESPVEVWWRMSADAEVDDAIRSIHALVAEETRRARPLCLASGRCCNFEAFGHRLYVTALETAWCLRQVARIGVPNPTAADIVSARRQGTCPFLVDGLCGVHTIRPFACRTFFCDRDATDWQRDLHERCHETMRVIHDRHEVPYRYGEWRELLGEFAEVGDGRRR